MKHTTILTLASVLALSACGGASKHDALIQEMTKASKEFVSVLETVTDKKSAEAAKPKLETIAKSIEGTQKKLAALEAPSADVEKKLHEKYRKEMEEIEARLKAVQSKLVANPEAMAALNDVMAQMSKAPK